MQATSIRGEKEFRQRQEHTRSHVADEYAIAAPTPIGA